VGTVLYGQSAESMADVFLVAGTLDLKDGVVVNTAHFNYYYNLQRNLNIIRQDGNIIIFNQMEE